MPTLTASGSKVFSKMIKPFLILVSLSIVTACASQSDQHTTAPESGLALQILGSGGPELDDGRAGSGYAIWYNGKARIIVDMGSGTLANFEKAGGKISDLDAILFTHFHVDHSADLPSLVKASYFSSRTEDLPIFGPSGNSRMPSANEFIGALFYVQGAYPYLSGYLKLRERYQLLPKSFDHLSKNVIPAYKNDDLSIEAIGVNHGSIPTLAWKVTINGQSIVFSGDMSGQYETLPLLSQNANLLVAHNAIPETSTGAARGLHMPPSVIGKIAAEADVDHVVLSHLMNRTNNKKDETLKHIEAHYQGKISFANDGDFFSVK